jgi:hypothetical protein
VNTRHLEVLWHIETALESFAVGVGPRSQQLADDELCRHLSQLLKQEGARGTVVVVALYYKPEGRGFEPQ